MRFDPQINLGQVLLAVSFALGGGAATAGFVYGTRQDIALLDYRVEVNEKADTQRALSGDEFRREVLVELRGIKDEVNKLRLELQEKEPRKR